MARTAVVAGTATAVSNRVSRRQAGRWEQQYQAEQYQAQQAAQQYAPPPPAPVAAAPAPAAEDDVIAKLEKLGDLHARGILTDEEFTAQKAALLA